MPEFAVLYDPQSDRWLRFSDPLEELTVHSPGGVIAALEQLEARVERDGLYAAGFVSYEAAAAFDDALQTVEPGDFPLLHFGLFAAMQPCDLPPPAVPPDLPDWRAQETAGVFTEKVKEIQRAIARGETYQVNLTFPLTSDFPGDAWSFFTHLVHGQRANGAGYLQAGRWVICSVSPELFFSRNADQLCMRPMKGTAPRGRTLAEDLEQAETLRQSAKNRAENIMILDMVRNDLGRLAPPGEVQVTEVCTLEKYPTVWQLTSTVRARSNASLAETFRALFPCASITGAPKARTMQIIATAEARPRRIYTGTFGWLAPGRRAHFNVAIRTALIDRQENSASYGVGAGITWDSDGAEEYRECLDKAGVLFGPRADFALVETLRWVPEKGYFILPEHLTRLQESAEYFDVSFSAANVMDYLQALAGNFPPAPQRVRLLLHQDGRIEGTAAPLEPAPHRPLRIRPAAQPVASHNPLLFHKTSRRQLYETALARSAGADEVVLWNERGEVTECCTANLVVEHAGRLVTPPLSSGLLPGTYRAFLLQRGIVTEQLLTLEDLHASPRIYLINAVRKWRRAVLCP